MFKDKCIQNIDKLGDIFINLNDHILNKEKSDEQLNFLDYYLFQASSYVMSLIHSRIEVNTTHLMNAFLLRSLIECLSIIRMYLDNKITDDSIELMKEYNYICEYRIYKKYKEQLDHKQFDFIQIDENFRKAKIKLKAYSKLNSNEFKELLNSKLPFLLDKYTFDDIVKKYCSGYYEFYGLLSIFLHPNDQLLTYGALREGNLNELELLLFNDLLALVAKNCNANFPMNKSLKQESLLIMSAPLNREYISLASAEKKSLFKISEIIEKEFGKNTQSCILKELGEAIENMAVDKSFGFSEIVKCKAKPVFEMIAMWNYIANLPHILDKKHLKELITKHTRIKLMDAHNIDSSSEIKEAFKKFENIDGSLSFEDFVESFKTLLGFMPKKTSINQFTYSMIDELITETTMKAHIKMVYDESQFLSHANGYMLQSNTGSFMEYSSAIVSTDLLTHMLLNKYILHTKLYDSIEGNGKYKKFISEIESEIEKFTEFYSKKNRIDHENQGIKSTY